MNNLYKRPMFRKGGSAEGGITSGLKSPRQGYALPGSVQQNDTSRQRIMDAMGMAPPRRNFNDFLINFGLDIATRPPTGSGFGGAISTIAAAAKNPYEQFAKARDAEKNLMRQVGMEAEIMDINKENAAAAAADGSGDGGGYGSNCRGRGVGGSSCERPGSLTAPAAAVQWRWMQM